MSAFQVSETTINAIATAYSALKNMPEALTAFPQAIANTLALQNELSLQARYGDEPERTEVPFEKTPCKNPLELLKRCHCYAYQACETSDWKATEAFAIVQALEENLEAQGYTRSHPEYDAAEGWN